MRLRALTAAAALAAAVAVVPSASAARTATVSGRVLDTAGQPVKGALVEFRRHASWGFFDWLACLIPVGPFCRSHTATARTDAAGRYAITVRTDSYVGTAGRRTVTAAQPGSTPGARTYTTFDYDAASVRLPDLRLWDGALVSVDPGLPGVRVLRVPPLPPEYGDLVVGAMPGATLTQRGSGTVWSYAVATYGRPVDARTVEAGTTHVTGWQRRDLDGWPVTYESAPRPVTGGVRPLSRGKPCYVYGKRDALVRLAGCRLTDGRLATDPGFGYLRAGNRRCFDCARRDSVLVDLGAVRPVGALAARAWACDVKSVAVSKDGRTYTPLTPLPALTDPDLLVYQPAEARYVRADFGFACHDLTELSVFAPLAL